MILYTSDRGDVFSVAAMETSHLINLIKHHRDQAKALEALHNLNLTLHIKMLERVIATLARELSHREVKKDQYIAYGEDDD